MRNKPRAEVQELLDWRNNKPANTSWEPSSGVRNGKTFWKKMEDPKFAKGVEDRGGESMGTSWGQPKVKRGGR